MKKKIFKSGRKPAKKSKYAFNLKKSEVKNLIKDTLKHSLKYATPAKFSRQLRMAQKFKNGLLTKKQQENLLNSNSDFLISGSPKSEWVITNFVKKDGISLSSKRLRNSTIDKLADFLGKRDINKIRKNNKANWKKWKSFKKAQKNLNDLLGNINNDRISEFLEIMERGGGIIKFHSKYPDDYYRLCDWAGLDGDELLEEMKKLEEE